MKKFATVAALVLFVGFAFAQGEASSACKETAGLTQVGTDNMACREGKWVQHSKVGARPISINLVVMDGDKVLTTQELRTLDGASVSYNNQQEVANVAGPGEGEKGKIVLTQGTIKTGWAVTLKPALFGSENINMEVRFSSSELEKVDHLTIGSVNVDLPTVSTQSTMQSVTMVPGQPVVLPFQKPVTNGSETYTLKMTVTAI